LKLEIVSQATNTYGEIGMGLRKRYIILVGCLILLLVWSTPLFGGMPGPAETEYLKTTGAGFNIDGKSRALFYTMSYQIKKTIQAPLHVSIFFQNPENSKAPFVESAVLRPNQKILRAESPAFKRIKNKTSYMVKVILYSDKDRKNPISTHSQQVFFSLSEKIAPKLGIQFIK